MNYKEIIGIVASLFVLASLTFNSTSLKANILMRSLNAVGSITFVVYGILIEAWSTAVCNLILAIFNIYYLVKLSLQMKKQKNILNKEELEKPEKPEKDDRK